MMSENESADSFTKPLDSKYLGTLLDHIGTAQDHLDGNDGTPLSPSFLSPNAVWTAREKGAFFHALSVHSRLRPDLISHDIKTKSVQDVCHYLSVLHAAGSQQEATVPYLLRRQNLPIAMEVSSEWVAMEEEKAADLTMRENDWQRELAEEQRSVEIKLLKKASRTESHGMGPRQRKAALEHQIADADLRARREDFCSSLGPLELTAIGAILCEATDFSGSSQIIPPSVLHTTLQPSAGHAERLEATQTLPFSVANAAHVQNPLNEGADEWPSPPKGTGPPPTSPPKHDSIAFLMSLSPASRRRHQKRLYMRRKRASMSGVADIDDSLERLKPGRKTKRPPSPKDDLDCVENEGGTTSACGADGLRMAQKRYSREKKMAFYELQGLGLASDNLRRSGLDILNPEGVAKMLSLWDKLSGDTAGHGSRISIETIKLLSLHVVCFVKELVYRAITFREQERILKSETKVWKLSGKTVLAREHIDRAVSVTCSRELNKARFFERIISEMNGNMETEEVNASGPEVTIIPPDRGVYTAPVWIPELGDDSEITDHTSDTELDSELLEEEELDKLDMDVEMSHESGLWDKAQKFQASDPSVKLSITETRQGRMYKSADFIEESD